VEFLNKHYEKLILLAVLLVFVLGMVFLLNTLNSTQEVKDSDLRIPTRNADYQVADAKSGEFVIANQWKAGNFNWKRGEARKLANAQFCYSDLVQFTPVSQCPFCSNLVPLSYFSEKKCPVPECGKLLHTPPARPKFRRSVITADDSDGDGMPDSFESRYNLDPKNPRDSQYDKDGDGFTNYYEMTVNTDPSNPRSRPPMWHRLRLFAVARVVLLVQFRALMDNKSDKQEMWDCQFNVQVVNRRTGKIRTSARMLKIGDELNIEGRNYKLVKLERKVRTKTQAEMKAEAEKTGHAGSSVVDESIAYFVEQVAPDSKYAPDKIEMQVGKTAYSSDRRPILVDDGLLPDERERDENKIALKPGQKYAMGDARTTGVERYVMYEYDDKTKTVIFHRTNVRGKEDPTVDARGKKILITSEGSIPEDCRIVPVDNSQVSPIEGEF
jgi:hypothetical protein